MVSHIWPRLVWVTNSQTSFCLIFKFQLSWCFTGISLEFKPKVPKKQTLFLTIIPPSFSCSLGSLSSSHSNEIVTKMPHNIRYSWLATLSTTCFSALPLLLCCSFYYWNLSVTGFSTRSMQNTFSLILNTAALWMPFSLQLDLSFDLRSLLFKIKITDF